MNEKLPGPENSSFKNEQNVSTFDEKDLGIKMENPNTAGENLFESTFNRDLDLAPFEVPTVLFELHENSLLYMDREEWDKALILLQKAQVLVDQTKYKKDRLIIVIIFHNTAL